MSASPWLFLSLAVGIYYPLLSLGPLAGFLTILLFYGDGVVSPIPQPRNWKTRISLFVCVITFDMFRMGGLDSSYATAAIALRII